MEFVLPNPNKVNVCKLQAAAPTTFLYFYFFKPLRYVLSRKENSNHRKPHLIKYFNIFQKPLLKRSWSFSYCKRIVFSFFSIKGSPWNDPWASVRMKSRTLSILSTVTSAFADPLSFSRISDKSCFSRQLINPRNLHWKLIQECASFITTNGTRIMFCFLTKGQA